MGSTDDFAHLIPARLIGPRVVPQKVSETARRLRKMKHLLVAGGYDDDLPPTFKRGDPGDETPFDPASAESA